jgi:UDP:flavonoid glycosyltransferase YjiC (YdhE family)
MWRARRWLGALLEPIATRLGLPGPPDPYGAVTIDPTPDALIIPDEFSGTRLPVRHGAPVPPAHPAYPVLAAADRPIVVTWGETMALLDERLMLSVRFAQALADGTAPVLVAAPPAQRRLISTQLAAIPSSRVRVVDDTQLPDVLAHAAAVVSQGGAGTVLTGLAAGVPQVVVGQLPDHLAIGRRVAAAGAGIALTPAEASDAVVREAVATVLADPGFAAKARVIARENAARPVPADLVAPLRRLATAPTSAAMIR